MNTIDHPMLRLSSVFRNIIARKAVLIPESAFKMVHRTINYSRSDIFGHSKRYYSLIEIDSLVLLKCAFGNSCGSMTILLWTHVTIMLSNRASIIDLSNNKTFYEAGSEYLRRTMRQCRSFRAWSIGRNIFPRGGASASR